MQEKQDAQNEQKNNHSLSWPELSPRPHAPALSGSRETPSAPSAGAVRHEGASVSQLIMVGAAGIVAGALLMWGGVSLRDGARGGAEKSDTVSSVQEKENAGLSGIPETNLLSVPVLQQSGMTVAVNAVEAREPLWAVVYEERNGGFGNALGAALFTPERRSGMIELIRGTLPEHTYFVALHRDNGDHVFELKSDIQLQVEGRPALVRFTAR